MRPWVWWGLWTVLGCGFVLLVPAIALADNCSEVIIPGDCTTSGRAAAGGAAAGGAALGGLGALGRGGRRTGNGARQPMPGMGPETPGSNVPRDASTGGSTPAQREYVRRQQEAQRRADEEAARVQERTPGQVKGLTDQGRPPRGPTDEVPGGDASTPGSNVERDDPTKR